MKTKKRLNPLIVNFHHAPRQVQVEVERQSGCSSTNLKLLILIIMSALRYVDDSVEVNVFMRNGELVVEFAVDQKEDEQGSSICLEE